MPTDLEDARRPCPRRLEDGRDAERLDDGWHDRNGYLACDYCGSMDPQEFLIRAAAGVPLEPTDKSYKVYVGDHLGGKFYFQHLSSEQRDAFIALLNGRALNISFPGHFYMMPFFVTRRPDAS